MDVVTRAADIPSVLGVIVHIVRGTLECRVGILNERPVAALSLPPLVPAWEIISIPTASKLVYAFAPLSEGVLNQRRLRYGRAGE